MGKLVLDQVLDLFLWTAFTDGLKTMKEIPKESLAQLDKMKKYLGELKWNLEKVLHDTTKMQEKVLLAFLFFCFTCRLQ